MTKPNLPPAPMSEAKALQQLKDSPIWPPEPPATCYVVLEFACVVDGAADLDAAYLAAEVQLREHLTQQACLQMKLITHKDYQRFMREWNPDDDNPLEGDCHWVIHPNNLPESPAALVAAVAEMEAACAATHSDGEYEPFDAERLNALSGLTALDARFDRVLIPGKQGTKRIGDGSHDMSYAEILWLLHRSVLNDHDKLDDHVFFESLDFVESGKDGVPLFSVFMGS